MKKSCTRAWMSVLLAVMLVVGTLSPMNVAFAQGDRPVTTGTNLEAMGGMGPRKVGTPTSVPMVVVTGIPEGETIESVNTITIDVTLPIPVIGDGGDDYYQYNDTITLTLSDHFQFAEDSLGKAIDLWYQPEGGGAKIKLGTATLNNEIIDGVTKAVAVITLDGEDAEKVFNPDKLPEGETAAYSGVSALFTAELKHNGTFDEDGEGNKTVTILDKTYTIKRPGDVITRTVTKTGVANADDTITWTVVVEAEKDTVPATHANLEGYVFEDDLAGVGEYVAGSFMVDNSTAYAGTMTGPSGADTVLRYTFGAGEVSPKTITFKTDIPDEKLTNGGDVTNQGTLTLGEDSWPSTQGRVTVTAPSATKRGVASDTNLGDYQPTGRTITWYVDVDNKGRTLYDLEVTDALVDMTLVSAQWQRWKDPGTEYNAATAGDDDNWENVTGAGFTWTGPTPPTGNKYSLGNVGYIGRLKIVASVPDDTTGSVEEKTYDNTATVTWKSAQGSQGSGTAQAPGVDIGYSALSKGGSRVAATGPDREKIDWTLTVDMRGQSASNYKVYDLFVHDSSITDAQLMAAGTGWPQDKGLTIGATNGVRRNNGQKFISASEYSPFGMGVTATDLVVGGKKVGTLVEIRNLQQGVNTVKLRTQVVDPALLANNNANQQIVNYASIHYDNGTTITWRDSANANVPFSNRVLSKTLLKRGQVDRDHNETDKIQPNDTVTGGNDTARAAGGFNYIHKEAIFRLLVNADKLDFKDVETTLDGGFGTVTVTDTLPVGWEFVPFSPDEGALPITDSTASYLIYDADGTQVTAPGPATAAFTTVGGKATVTVTFDALDDAYVILVKARPADSTLDGYLTGANTRDAENTANLRSANWSPGKEAKQSVRVNSAVLTKNETEVPHEDKLNWSVDYTPLDRGIGTVIRDTLPQGLDLRTDSGGQLIWLDKDGSRNVNVQSLIRANDGTYTPGAVDEFSLEQVQSWVRYQVDETTGERLLTFQIPDSAKDYRLSYVTDITGTPGKIQNKVELVDVEGTGTSTNKPFTIQANHGSAIMGRSGFAVVRKENNQGNPLLGAQFTLYNVNPDGTRGTARGMRTTGSDGKVTFYGLTPGSYQLVESQLPGADGEYLPNPAVYRVEVAENLTTTVDGGPSNPFTVVNYKPADPVGSLSIEKRVLGTDADRTKEFEFTVTLTAPGGGVDPNEYAYTGTGGAPGGTVRSGGTVTLAHGQTITVTGLPVDTAYTVTEADYTADGYRVDRQIQDGTIALGTVSPVTFTNTKNLPGDLTVGKRVAGESFPSDRGFRFTVTFDNEPVPGAVYSYTGEGVPGGTIHSGGTVTLAHGQEITIHGLPEGTTYTVTEEDYTSEGYLTQVQTPGGTVDTQGGHGVSFTNYAPGSLTVTKTVEGGGDPDLEFGFRVTLEGEHIQSGYPYTKTTDGGTQTGTLLLTDGVGTFQLGGGDSITITGLAKDTAYRVEELLDPDTAAYIPENAAMSGTIAAGGAHKASFTNHAPGRLSITKTVAAGGDQAKKFDFTVTFAGEQVRASYPYTGFLDGAEVTDGVLALEDGAGTVSLAHGEFILISGLSLGTQYTVAEGDYTREGYVSQDSVSGRIDQGGQLHDASFVNRKRSSSGEDTVNLIITKTVEGAGGDRQRQFTFEVTFDAGGYYGYSGSSSGMIKSGQRIRLAHGESVNISGLPQGTRYAVTEVEADRDGYTTTAAGGSGTLDRGTRTASFVNTRGHANPNTGDGASASRAMTGLFAFGLSLAGLVGLDASITHKRKRQKQE